MNESQFVLCRWASTEDVGGRVMVMIVDCLDIVYVTLETLYTCGPEGGRGEDEETKRVWQLKL